MEINFTTRNDEIRINDLLKYGLNFESVKDSESLIKKNLKERGLEINLNNPIEKVLLRQLASRQTLIWFEQTYNIIFGSQISMLQKALEHYNVEITKDYILGIFEGIKKSNSDIFKDWNIKDYLKFLFDNGLILEENDRIFLTVQGKEFLQMMKNTNYSGSKNL